MRPLATISHDLDWYGWDDDGGSVHDVIGLDGPRNFLVVWTIACCHSNLIRALSAHCQLDYAKAEPLVHDVLNVLCVPAYKRHTPIFYSKSSAGRFYRILY